MSDRGDLSLPENLARVKIPSEFYIKSYSASIFYSFVNTSVILSSGSLAYHLKIPWLYIVAFLLVGINAQALFLLQHEAMHRILVPSQRINRRLGILISAILGTRFFDGTDIHMRHHKDIGEKTDPNLYWYDSKKNKPGWGVIRFMLFQLLGAKLIMFATRTFSVGLSFLIDNRKAIKSSGSLSQVPVSSEGNRDIAALFVVQAVIFSGISWAAHPWVYFFLYFLPICTITGLLESIRSFSEHARYEDSSKSFAEHHRLYYVKSNFWERFLMSQYGFHYHHIHHMYPTVPVFRLRKLHNWLIQDDSTYSQKYIERDTYTNVLLRYILNRPLEKPRNK